MQDFGLLVDAAIDELGVYPLRSQHLFSGLGGTERIGLGRGRGRLLCIGDPLGRAGLELRKRQWMTGQIRERESRMR